MSIYTEAYDDAREAMGRAAYQQVAHRGRAAGATLGCMLYDGLVDGDRAVDTLKLKWLLRGNVLANGRVCVEVWGRDCDLYESTSLNYIEPTVEAWAALDEALYRDAEGPYSMRILSPAAESMWNPYTRDRAAELAGY